MICYFDDAFVLIESDECDSNPCGNGGTCNDYINEFNCTCTGGYEGTLCETGKWIMIILLCLVLVSVNDDTFFWFWFVLSDINECTSTPCQNGGSCDDLINGYNCTCVSGYAGSDCETGTACFS